MQVKVEQSINFNVCCFLFCFVFYSEPVRLMVTHSFLLNVQPEETFLSFVFTGALLPVPGAKAVTEVHTRQS